MSGFFGHKKQFGEEKDRKGEMGHGHMTTSERIFCVGLMSGEVWHHTDISFIFIVSGSGNHRRKCKMKFVVVVLHVHLTGSHNKVH